MPPLPDLEHQLFVLARRIAKPVPLLSPEGETALDRPAYQALWRIVEDGPVRPTALAAALEIDLSVVSRQLRSLEDAGLITRTTDPVDARAALVRATPAGLAAFAETQERRSRILEEAVQDWSEQDREVFTALLTRFNDKMESTIMRLREERRR